MAVNSLHPGFILIFYTAAGRQHKQTLPVFPEFNTGTNVWEVQQNNGVMAPWNSSVDAYVPFVQNFLRETDSIDYAELWTETYPEGVRQFRATMPIGENGVNEDAGGDFSQLVITFRTDQGGLLRLYYVDIPITSVNEVFTPPYTGHTDVGNMVGYVTGTGGMIQGRDGGRPIASIRATTKTNDALRKRYLL